MSSTSTPSTALPWRAPRVWLRVLGGLLLGGLLLSKLEWQPIWEGLKHFTGGRLALLALLFSASAGLRLYRWQLQVRAMKLKAEPRAFVRTYVLGLALGAVTPLRLGELYRISALEKTEATQGSVTALTAAGLVLEKGFEVVLLLWIATLGALWEQTWPWVTLGLLGLTWMGGLVLLTPLSPPASLRPLRWTRPLWKLWEPFELARACLELRTRGLMLLLTLLGHALNLTAGLLIYGCFGTLDPWAFLFRMPLLTLASVLPVTVGGMGLRELLAMEIFGALGFPASGAAVSATLLFLGSNVWPLTALVWALRPATSLGASALSKQESGS